MTLEELKDARGTYDIYGGSMLSRETMDYLFNFAISAQENETPVATDAEPTQEAKPKRAKKAGD